MLVVTHFDVPEAEDGEFRAVAQTALAALAARPGHVESRLARATDDPAAWVLVSEWDSVGSYRRALTAYEVRVAATPLLARSRNAPSAFEVLLREGAGTVSVKPSDRAAGGTG